MEKKKEKERKKKRERNEDLDKKKGSLKETTLFHLVPSLSSESRVKMCSIMKVCSHFSDKCIRLRDSRLKKYRIVAIKHFRRTQWLLVQQSSVHVLTVHVAPSRGQTNALNKVFQTLEKNRQLPVMLHDTTNNSSR